MDRKVCFEKALAITQRQTEILEAKNIEEFNDLLEKRQEIVDEINKQIDKPLEQEEIDIIKQIKEIDEQHKQIVEKIYSELQDEVKQFRMKSKQVMSYESGGTLLQMGGYYFDKK